MKKDLKVYLVLVVAVIAIIFLIYYIKGNGKIDEKTMKCIANNSLLIVKEGCNRCAAQKQILGNYTSYFKKLDCNADAKACTNYGVRLLPAWIIKGEKYEEIFSLEELKNLTGC